MKQENKRVLNAYGVLFALWVAERFNKNPGEVINLFNEKENVSRR